MAHIPVLLKEAIELLDPQSGDFVIDGTFGAGGHTKEILEKVGETGKVLAIDWDADAIKKGGTKLVRQKNIILEQGNYADLPEIIAKLHKASPSIPLRASGLLIDLGFSSEQMDESERGFSFNRTEPLDMRYDTSEGETAGEIINSYPEKDLADIFWKYGEERFSRIAARKIVEARRLKKILTSKDLADIVEQAIPRRRGKVWSKIHPATRIFQALRIYVNKELENLEKALMNLDEVVKSKGRVCIISFHSLEDRMVKIRFRELQKEQKAEILTKKPVIPTDEEVLNNPRSRSAKMRAIKLI